MNDVSGPWRRSTYTLLIVVSAAIVAGRLGSAELLNEPSVPRKWPAVKPTPMPTFSSNDRSRWATVRALVDGDPENGQPPGTFVVGRRDRRMVLISALSELAASNPLDTASAAAAAFYVRTQKSDRGIIFEDGWQSVDKVLHPEKLEFLSSKPPLLTVLMAGLYWLLQTLTGWTLAEHPFAVVRTLLFLVNWLPFLLYLGLLARLSERYGKTDWGRLFVVAGAGFATLVTLFAITFNNHSLAAYSVVFALYPALTILQTRAAALAGGSRLNGPWYAYVLAGLFASFTACCELPAASFAVALFAILLWWSPWRTLFLFLPAALVPVAAFFLTNYTAVGQLRPAYSEFGGVWYEYEGSHWRKPIPGEVKTGIDWAGRQETRRDYAVHVLVGHHGIFSLTPLWLLAAIGIFRFSRADVRFWLTGKDGCGQDPVRERIQGLLAGFTLVLSVVVVGFYLSERDARNYGGWTAGLRWLMWLSPLWLLTILPIADWFARRRGTRALALLLLGMSIFSVAYSAINPWRHPWIYHLMEALGWRGY